MKEKIKESIEKAGRNLRRRWAGLIITIGLFIGIYLLLGLTAAVVASLLALLYTALVDGRVAVFAGIVLLAVCAILLAAGNNYWAERCAAWVFYFFLIGIILQLIELWSARRAGTPDVGEMPAYDNLGDEEGDC